MARKRKALVELNEYKAVVVNPMKEADDKLSEEQDYLIVLGSGYCWSAFIVLSDCDICNESDALEAVADYCQDYARGWIMCSDDMAEAEKEGFLGDYFYAIDGKYFSADNIFIKRISNR